ncbi:bifunctional folylpolyglutamate synthase/dihydrofolate synthase [Bacillus halotolerans]|uniref:bifunctional folylpolyglutamate synthase/dihydrofolate synthase n=1 Tax=Bacillus halotolerans TaxID=260554 RepID=UPI0007503F31|nr:folylpolyglutamate synthase/dihydrofolate synthase family protein [Bacillus halotolerans]KUP29717.1 bifunctional folylpolyglutamate synthase/dihydrofolate synthase [Bacillus halotolerans]MBT9249492.1 bifunctional folylpolyglutamate synthase/dihydrofolate synthase [Bacillus halotolerans]MDL5612931.1 folylpolyglutamate synthase/dihydrofolate synthase family protein [Bacillus halotolerans]MEC0280642.1 bifunctional folylpolyglutamate synthase/dihydrofolate synthase [Bacillus halotolerans]MEC154
MFTAYEEARSWIHSRLKFGVKPGLDRMKQLMARLDHPEKNIRALHVAGTNGKGSTVAFIRSMLQEAGYTVGTFTSPYIITFNERISVNGTPITDEEWVTLVNQVKPIVEELDQTEHGQPTEFEIMTACAFLYFAAYHQVDFVIFETGLGGRYDSTNVVEPLLTVITSIGHDHMNILGNTIEEIAGEKAGIIKEGIPIVTAVTQPEALQVIRHEAERKSAPFQSLHDTSRIYNEKALPAGEQFSLKTGETCYEDIRTSLIGTHQRQNAALSILAAEWLNRENIAELSDAALRSGLIKAAWPGRLELVQEHPPVYLDGAHNEEGIDKLTETMKQRFPDSDICVVFSALKDKPYHDMIKKLETIAHSIHFASFDFPRASLAKDLYDASEISSKSWNEDPEHVIKLIESKKGSNDIVLITGSLYFISDIRKRML